MRCRIKHTGGKHTAAGRKRYKEAQSDRKFSGETQQTVQINKNLSVTGVKTRKKGQKCVVSDRKHYPFCKSVRDVYNVCKKKHQLFCREKTETAHAVVDIPSIKDKLKMLSKRKKAQFAATIVANFGSLFWISNCVVSGNNFDSEPTHSSDESSYIIDHNHHYSDKSDGDIFATEGRS